MISVTMILFICLMVYNAFHDIITNETVYINNLPNDFENYRVFFIADVHRRTIKRQTLKRIDQQIDVVFLGGDMVERFVPLKRFEKNLQTLSRWEVPIFFVAGNNDYEQNKADVHRILQQYNVTILEDEAVILQKNHSSMTLVGLPYIYDESLRTFDYSTLRGNNNIMLTHSPYTYYELPATYQKLFAFVLAGHTHGGQIRILSYGPYRRGGWRYKQETSMFITEGYGYSLLPFRLETEAQCHVITWKKK